MSAWLMVGCADDLPAGPSRDVPIQHDYGTKIVYGSAPGVLGAVLRRHCRNVNGTFNRCGTICAPDAPTCAATCAFTCEDIPDRIVEIPPLPNVEP